MNYNSLKELMGLADEKGCKIGEIVAQVEAEQDYRTVESVEDEMTNVWRVMRASILEGLTADNQSMSGLSGGDAKRLNTSKPVFLDAELSEAVAMALGVAELNACMGKIVACPTAGSCGIVPAAMTYAKGKLGSTEEEIVSALFTSAGIGIVCSINASISGAEGGCQAECGVAAAMAAGAMTELAGGSPDMVGHAVALTLTNIMGLVCDPVAGLVEVPCILRNAGALMQGILASELSLSGVISRIPVDEVIDAMREVGEALPDSLKETAEGGLANTATGRRVAKALNEKG